MSVKDKFGVTRSESSIPIKYAISPKLLNLLKKTEH